MDYNLKVKRSGNKEEVEIEAKKRH